MMLASDAVGIVSGIFLALPPIRDQIGRLREGWHKSQSHVPALRRLLILALREKRDSFSGIDSLFLLAGAALLAASFGLKLVDR